MAEAHSEVHSGGEHSHGDLEPLYLRVFGVLVVCTAISFITVSAWWVHSVGHEAGHTVVMIVAVIKALLVAMFFMHLKWDWNKLYFMLVPSLVVGAILCCALLPDITFSDTRIKSYDHPPPAATVRP
jgi:cytochrome c oxidase subunit 4